MKPNKFDRIDATKTRKHPAVSLSQTMRRFESEYSLVFYLNFAFLVPLSALREQKSKRFSKACCNATHSQQKKKKTKEREPTDVKEN